MLINIKNKKNQTQNLKYTKRKFRKRRYFRHQKTINLSVQVQNTPVKTAEIFI